MFLNVFEQTEQVVLVQICTPPEGAGTLLHVQVTLYGTDLIQPQDKTHQSKSRTHLVGEVGPVSR